MVALLTHDPFDDDGWVYERKLDGVRVLVFRGGATVRLLGRNRKDLGGAFPEVVVAAGALTTTDLGRTARWSRSRASAARSRWLRGSVPDQRAVNLLRSIRCSSEDLG